MEDGPRPEEEEELTLQAGVAAMFFNRSLAWLRVQENKGFLVREDGSEIVIKRHTKGKTQSARVYSLDDLDDIADALFRQRKISRKDYDGVKKKVAAFRE